MRSLILIVLLLAAPLAAQIQSLGSVAATDADVNNPHGTLQVVNGRVDLSSGSVVTARNRTAEVKLARSGIVRVCRTSSLHLASGGDAMLLALDRGAMQLEFKTGVADVVMTPDLRIEPVSAGELDLRLRVTPNGDTCVENRGRKAPVLNLSDVFGEASYQVRPGQHVLFEHGNLHEVVDNETTPCGCPPDDAPPVPLADALLLSQGAKVTPAQVAAANPFPAAQSQGLAEPTPPAPETPGGTHVQVATTLSYDPASPPPATASPATGASSPLSTPPPKRVSNPFAAIGRFFKRLFVR